MANQIECLCQLDENHHEIGCFFKYVVFLLKRFVSSLNLLTMDPKDEHKDILKNDIWIQIATQYDGYFTDCETDSSCVDGCVLKLLQKCAENQLKFLASERRANLEHESRFHMDNIQFALHRNMEYNGTYPDLTHMVFLLELIVANPPLFDQNHPSFGDAEFKFKIWNEICAAWYKKDQNYCANFFFQCRFAEQLLHRISDPLNVKIDASEHDDLHDGLSGIASSKSIPRLVCDLLGGGDGSEPAALHIKNVEKLYVITNNKKADDTTPTNNTPQPLPAAAATDDAATPKEKKKKFRRKRFNRDKNTDDQFNQRADMQPQSNNGA